MSGCRILWVPGMVVHTQGGWIITIVDRLGVLPKEYLNIERNLIKRYSSLVSSRLDCRLDKLDRLYRGIPIFLPLSV